MDTYYVIKHIVNGAGTYLKPDGTRSWHRLDAQKFVTKELAKEFAKNVKGTYESNGHEYREIFCRIVKKKKNIVIPRVGSIWRFTKAPIVSDGIIVISHIQGNKIFSIDEKFVEAPVSEECDIETFNHYINEGDIECLFENKYGFISTEFNNDCVNDKNVAAGTVFAFNMCDNTDGSAPEFSSPMLVVQRVVEGDGQISFVDSNSVHHLYDGGKDQFYTDLIEGSIKVIYDPIEQENVT